MRRSTKFARIYFICFLLMIPGYQFAVNKITEWRLETAIKDFVLRECGVKLRQVDVQVEFMRIPGPFVVGKDWRGTSDPKVGQLRGYLVNDTISFYGACDKSDPYTSLKLEGTQFVRTKELSDSFNERNPRRVILFLTFVVLGGFGWIFLRRREERESQEEP